MKTFLFALFLAPFLTLQPSFNSIAKAIGSGDVEVLSKFFDENVEITILDKVQTFDKQQATVTLKDFFTKNKPKNFNQVHSGTSKGKEAHYCIGDLATLADSYRVYVYMKVNNDSYLIQELRFEKE